METEVWKAVVGYDGFYEVSNIGRVRGLDRITKGRGDSERLKKGAYLSLNKRGGYTLAPLWRDGKCTIVGVHRLVAIAFIGNPNNKPQVNHLNSIRNDNRTANLEWCTCSENLIHASENGRLLKGDNHPKTKVTFKNADSIRDRYAEGFSMRDLAKMFLVDTKLIWNVINNKGRFKKLN